MAAFKDQRPSATFGSLSSQFWSPLEPGDVGRALVAVGAHLVDVRGNQARFAISPGQEAFAPTLVLEPLPAARGSVVRVHAVELGFLRDFTLAVQLGLGGFMALMGCYAALELGGSARDSVLLALGVAWLTAMGAFAVLRGVAAALSSDGSSAEACRRARLALFAQIDRRA